jgi:hypothetical protein
VSQDFTIRPGRKEDAAAAARLWMHSAQEHEAHDRVYETAPGAEKTMRRFLADMASSGYSSGLSDLPSEDVGFRG